LIDPDDFRDGCCFLCEPAPDLVYAESENFFAMLGLGPISEGYSLIAARTHAPSMLDLPVAQRHELVGFTKRVRARLDAHYAPSTVTEHGRVPPCIDRHVRVHEPHCLHAHQLVFPGSLTLDLDQAVPALQVQRFESFLDAATSFRDPGQFLYAESPDGQCQLASVRGPFPRQFFRRLVAASAGSPRLANWRVHPRHELIAAARERIRLAS
jgi:hypothetical protein